MAGFENFGLESGMLVDPDHIPDFLDLAEDYSDAESTLLDQNDAQLSGLTADQQHWRDHGYVIKRNFIPHHLIDEYVELRRKLEVGSGPIADCHPHLYSEALRDICCSRELHYLIVDLIGEELGLHFTLNGFKSTERGWHQDDYLNPEDTLARYAAVWMAMGDIDPDSGPFEFIPGSHKWPCMRREKVKAFIKPEIRNDPSNFWICASEYYVNKAVESHMKVTGSKAEQFQASKGDILIWNAKLMHRGSIPNNPELVRPALICHYSSIKSRRDIGSNITRHGDGGYFWEFPEIGEVLTEDKHPRTVTSDLDTPTLSLPKPESNPTVIKSLVGKLRKLVPA
jgi:hypothetical protein